MNQEDTSSRETPPNPSGGGGPVITIVIGLAVVILAIVLIFTVNTSTSAPGSADQPAPAPGSAAAEDQPAGQQSQDDGESEQQGGDEQAPAPAPGSSGSTDQGAADAPSAGGETSGGGELEPLPLELPNPVFAGTPSEPPEGVRIDRRRLGKRRPPFMAPPGAQNVALGKPVTSSDSFPIIGTLELATDGDKEALDGRYVELAPDKQHITIDLGSPHEIYAIVIWHNHMEPRVYRDVVVRLADNPDFGSAQTVFNNDHDNSSGFGAGEDFEYFESDEGELIAHAERRDGRLYMTEPLGTARYVRCWSNGSTADDLNHYTEVEVWAKPAEGGRQ